MGGDHRTSPPALSVYSDGLLSASPYPSKIDRLLNRVTTAMDDLRPSLLGEEGDLGNRPKTKFDILNRDPTKWHAFQDDACLIYSLYHEPDNKNYSTCGHMRPRNIKSAVKILQLWGRWANKSSSRFNNQIWNPHVKSTGSIARIERNKNL